MRLTGEDVLVRCSQIDGFEDAVLEVGGVSGALIVEELSQLVVAAVAGLGVDAPAVPDASSPVAASDVELAGEAVGDDVDPADTGQRALPTYMLLPDDGVQL